MENLLKLFLGALLRTVAKISPELAAKLAWSFFCWPRTGKKPFNEIEKKLLLSAKQFYVQSGEYKIAAYCWKNTNNISDAKTVMFTHGWGGHALNFAPVISHLINNGYDVIAHDSPAHGNSSGKYTNLLCNTKALLAVLQNSAPVSALVGHSFGSLTNAYAFEFLSQSPEAELPKKMVFIAGPNELSDIFSSFIQSLQLPTSVLTIFHKKLKKLAKRKIETMSAVKFMQKFSGSCLVIHDEHDRIVPFSEAKTVAQGINAELFATQSKGHFRILASRSVSERIKIFLKNR